MGSVMGADPYESVQKAAMVALQRAAQLEMQERKYELDLQRFRAGQEHAAERIQILKEKQDATEAKNAAMAQYKEYEAMLKGQAGHLNAIKVYKDALETRKKAAVDSFRAGIQASAELSRVETGRMSANRAAQAAAGKPLSIDYVNAIRAEMDAWVSNMKSSPRALDVKGIDDFKKHSTTVPSGHGATDPKADAFVRGYLGADPTNRDKVYQGYARAAQAVPPALSQGDVQQFAEMRAEVARYKAEVAGYQDFLGTDPGRIVEGMALGVPPGAAPATAPDVAASRAHGATSERASGAAPGGASNVSPGLPYGVLRTSTGDLSVSIAYPRVVAWYLEIG